LIEQAIFTCIGFLVAALLALAATPAIARRARRLAEARARLQTPLTEAQAIAERDALRAQHAVDQVRLEQRLATLAATAALRQIELGRQASRIVALEDVSGERAAELGRQRDELAALGAEARDLRGQLGAAQVALQDLTAQRDSAASAFAASEAARLELATLGDEQRATIATLETRAAALEVRFANSERAAAAAAKSARAEIERLSAALGERKQMASRLEADLEAATTRGARVVAELAAARARLGEAEALLARSEAAREEALLENGRQFSRIAERDAALRALGADPRALTSGLAAPRAEPPEKDRAAIEAELAESHREIEQLRAQLAGAAAGARPAGDPALRNAIARLGRDVLRLSGKTARPVKAETPAFAAFERRETPPHPVPPAEALHPAPAGKILQGQPMAPER
jgi:chromosome segregation ATPase